MAAPHIAIVASPVPGHWDPLRVLATTLMRSGARVTFVHMPDAARLVRVPGVGFAAIDDGRHGPGGLARFESRLTKAGSALGGLAMIRAQAAITGMLLRELPDAFARIGADAVVADLAEPAAALAARRAGLPYVTSITGLPLQYDPAIPPPFVDWPYEEGRAATKRNRGGWRVTRLLMRPIDRVLGEAARVWNLDPHPELSPLLAIAQCPEALDFPRACPSAALRYTGPWRAQARSALPTDDGRPLVYCSLGSLQGDRPQLFAAMTAACADLGARAIVAHGGRLSAHAVATLPGDPIVGAHWHQPSVLPRCSAAILHAGFNTVLDALAAGVPMVVAPIAFEQPGTAARVAWTGAGVKLDKRRLDRASLRDALQQVLLRPSYRVAAEGLAEQMRFLGGVDQAAKLVLDAIRTGRTPPTASATTAFPDAGDARGGNRRNGSS